MILRDNDIIIDVETSCDLDLTVVGAYKYAVHPSLRLLLLSFSTGTCDEVFTYDIVSGQQLPTAFIAMLVNPAYRKHAHNAVFEICVLENVLCTKLYPEQWYCSMAAVAFCGLPLGLEDSANTLEHQYRKLTSGKILLDLFSKKNKQGTYNTPFTHPQDWSTFVLYNKQDVLAEKENLLCLPEIPEIFESGIERDMWVLDFQINYNGVRINPLIAFNADKLCEREDVELIESVRHSGISNINSGKQVMAFLTKRGYSCNTMKATDYEGYLKQTERDELATLIINVKKNLSLSSATKFQKFLDTEVNGKIYFTLQYYGANRTGRWSGRGAQPQNLKRNEMDFECLSMLRELVKQCDYESIVEYFGNVKENITELGRTIIEPPEGEVLLSSDFSAIEARITAWLAGEQWRLDVFNTHGKIYEASAAMMFKLKIEDIKKGSMERIKGKYAELALGFGGWVGAFSRFGADKFMTKKEIEDTAKAWRKANPAIVAMWKDVEECAICSVRDFGNAYTTRFGVTYQGIEYNGRQWLTCTLLSGRRLFYYSPKLIVSKRNTLTFSYRKLANEQDIWFGILIENIVQAIARDLLVEKMVTLNKVTGIVPVLHVHDEIVLQDKKEKAPELKRMLDALMSQPISWANGLPLKGDTTVLPFYMKGE